MCSFRALSLSLLLGTMILSSCATKYNAPACELQENCRPFRAGVIKLSQELDNIKPLAPIDLSGWVLANDVIIANLSNQWLAGLSTKDRRVLWWLETPSGITAPISVFGTWAVVGLRDGRVLKIETQTGKKVWESRLGKFIARPTVLGGSVLVGITASQQIYGIDFQTGTVNWLYDAGEPESLTMRTAAPALIRDKFAFVGTDKGDIHAIDLATGRLEWKINPEYSNERFHDVVGEMVTTNNQLTITRNDGLITSFNLVGTEHTPIWKEKLPTITTSYFRNGIIYVGCLNGDIYAFDAANGRKLWRTPLFKSVSTLTAGEKTLYVGGSNGRISAINVTTGKMLWQDDIQGAIDAAPTILQDKIYFGTGLKVLYGYRLL